ncbi:hypothetical protein HZC53_01845 [Candidatus Uhrbacteria bacterium]|nr:hypothetical protein [Candidatus Uhrbacteria bacterium]
MCQECEDKKNELFNRRESLVYPPEAIPEVRRIDVCVCQETGQLQHMFEGLAAHTFCQDIACKACLDELKFRPMCWDELEHAEATTGDARMWLEAHKRHLAKKLADAAKQELLLQARIAEEEDFMRRIDAAQAKMLSVVKSADECMRAGRRFDRGIYNELVRQSRMKMPTVRSELEKWLKRAISIAERAEVATASRAA